MLKKRGEVWWLDSTINKTRIRESLGTTDKREALARANLLERAAWEGKLGSKARAVTLREAFDELMVTHWSETKDYKGVASRFTTLTRYIPETTPVAEVTKDKVDLFVVAMKKAGYQKTEGGPTYPYSRATINRILAMLGFMMNRMAEKDVIAKAPKMPKSKETGRKRYLSDNEELLMFSALETSGNPSHLRALRLFMFLTDTGCRLSEPLKLEWADVLFEHRRIILRDTKSGSDVGKGLTTRALGVLRAEQADGYSRPFAGLTSGMYRKAWDYAKEAAGLAEDDSLVRHSLRHTTATRLVQRQVPLKDVQDFLGHKNFQTTLGYAHFADGGSGRAVSALEGVTDL